MRYLALSLLLFGTTPAHAGWFGSAPKNVSAKPSRTPAERFQSALRPTFEPTKARSLVPQNGQPTKARSLIPQNGQPTIEAQVEGPEHMGINRDRVVAVLESSFEQLQAQLSAGSWRVRQRAMPGYRQAKREAQKAITSMQRAGTDDERQMFHRRALAAHNIAVATLEIRFDGLEHNDPTLRAELADMQALGSALDVAHAHLGLQGHVVLRSQTPAGTKPILSNTLNRTAAQISFMPPPVPHAHVAAY